MATRVKVVKNNSELIEKKVNQAIEELETAGHTVVEFRIMPDLNIPLPGQGTSAPDVFVMIRYTTP